MVKKVAIIKLKSEHDIEWRPPKILTGFGEYLPLGIGKAIKKIKENEGKSFMPQITPYYLAALGREYDRNNGSEYNFEVIDAYLEEIEANKDYDMVWFTTLTTTAKQVYTKADEFREKDIKVILGGVHPSMLPEEAKEHADSVAIGEGENLIPEILRDFSNGELKERYNGGIAKDIGNLPIPAWELGEGNYASWILPVQTSRGCGNACSYCSTTRFQGGKRRHRTIENIIYELENYIEKGRLTEKNVVFFTDNNSVADTNYRRGVFDSRYAKSLFKAIRDLREKKRINFNWIGQGEINMANDDELLELSATSGCITQLIGYESLSQNNLDSHNKIGNNVEEYARQTEKIHNSGIQIIGCFVFGMPNDTPDTFKITQDFIKNYIDIPQIALLTPYPGTRFYKEAKEKDLILHEDWNKYDITHVVSKPECKNKKGLVMTPKELEKEYADLAKKVYSWPSIFARALKAANRKSEYNHRNRISKFSSVFAPNLIYRELANIDRGL